MNFITKAIKKAKEKRLAEKAEKQRILQLFEKFVIETKPFVPKSPQNPKAALFRLCWKRAIVLQDIYEKQNNNSDKVHLYDKFRHLAANYYSRVAPENAYGRVPLKISGEARMKMQLKELERMNPSQQKKLKKNLKLACIYVGIDTIEKKPYIGQTTGNPESRWKEHRNNGTGPFKNGASYATWKVLKENVPPNKLNELESYYIGLYNTYENGHNETYGNDWQFYEKGKNKTQR